MDKGTNVRYIGRAPKKNDNVVRSGLFWPKRGFVVSGVQDDVALKLCRYPDVWVVADSDSDPFKGESFDGIDTEFISNSGSPLTREEKVLDAAKMIESLEGQQEALNYWRRDITAGVGLDAVTGNQPVMLGNDRDESISQAIELIVSQNPEMDDPQYFSQDGRPKVTAIAGITGNEVTAEQRDNAWDIYQEHIANLDEHSVG